MKPLILNKAKLHTSVLNKHGQLLNEYQPLYNTIDELGLISDCSTTEDAIYSTTSGLGFDMSHPVDMLIQPSYDGGVNIILNDDKNPPKLINSRFSVQEDSTFKITDRIGFKDTNLYNKNTFASETSLIPHVDKILKISFDGLLDDAGTLQSGIYIFYFKYIDADGNMTEVQGESGLVYIHKGETNTPSAIRFGLENESTDKAVKFTLSNIDLGYNRVQVYYSRIYGNENGRGASIYKILNPFFISANGTCDITITGSEYTEQVSAQEVQASFADLGSVATQTSFQGMLLQGNVSKTEHDFEALKQLSWRVYPTILKAKPGSVGCLRAKNYEDPIYYNDSDVKCCYYNTKNLYYRVGYWPEEIYRFGIVYIFEDGSLSPVFDTLGVDFVQLQASHLSPDIDLYEKVIINGETQYSERKYEPENGQFTPVFNSKGVVRMPKDSVINYDDGVLTPTPMYVQFNLQHIAGRSKRNFQYILKEHKIKGYFIVRQIRVPNILCQGLVIQQTGKDLGGLPCLQQDGKLLGQSFLDKNRYISHNGYFSVLSKSRPQAFLSPDAILQTAVFNDIFTSSKVQLSPIYKCLAPLYESTTGDYLFKYASNSPSSENIFTKPIKIINVPDGSTVLTNGIDYFCGQAGIASDATKTSDLKYEWDYNYPQDLSLSTSVVRGIWSTYAGLEYDEYLKYGHICNVYKDGRVNTSDQNSEVRWLDNTMKTIKDSNAPYYAVCDRQDNKTGNVDCFRGDCFISLYTHRMFRNFIDPTYPTNTQIVDISSWRKNYAVRCSAFKTNTASGASYNNCQKENEGWCLTADQEVDRTQPLYNQIASKFVLDVKKLGNQELHSYDFSEDTLKYRHENAKGWNDGGEHDDWQIFDYINGEWRPRGEQQDSKPLFLTDVPYADSTLGDWWKYTYLEQPDPPKETGFALIDFAITTGYANAHEFVERKASNINLSDLNAVGLGQWVTFPVCSNLNIAMRDVDFKQASEEALFNEKRGFFPLKEKNRYSKIPDSYCINNALKNTVPTQQYVHIPNKVFFKQEFFNRIYYSRIDSATTDANEWRQISSVSYVDYTKEYGSITKLIDNGNNVYVIFEHGIGSIPVNIKEDGSVGIGALQILDTTYGSMWKDSIVVTDVGVFGVDTVAKAIWKLTGEQLDIVSTRTINKFLVDNIDMSETTRFPYIGHVNVKTHYNKNKHDVIFTYYNDIPYLNPNVDSIVDINQFGEGVDKNGNVVLDKDNNPYILEKFVTNWDSDSESWKRLTDDMPILWKQGKQWSVCYNLELGQFITFYDWIPLESQCIDNIFFTFDKDSANKLQTNNVEYVDLTKQDVEVFKINKHSVDSAMVGITNRYLIQSQVQIPHNVDNDIYTHYRFYLKANTEDTNVTLTFATGDTKSYTKLPVGIWMFFYGLWPNTQYDVLTITAPGCDICDFSLCKLDTNNTFNEVLTPVNGVFPISSYSLRDDGNRMYLWKHGQAGIYDNQGKIKPTFWYGKQHEFNFEFVVNDSPGQQKIFNNLKLLSNKTAPTKFEYEIVGEGYEWFEYKPIVEWINKKSIEDPRPADPNYWWTCVLNRNSKSIINGDGVYPSYPDFPALFDESRVIKKLPYLKMKHTDKKGTPERPHYEWDNGTDYWGGKPYDKNNQEYTYNCSEPCLIEDDQLNEVRLRTESLGNDIRKYGRIRGNMQYLEDLWDVEIRPVQITWCYLDNKEEFQTKKVTETRHRDKYLKVRVRYSGEDVALIRAILTIFDESYT